jgi:cytochrome P450
MAYSKIIPHVKGDLLLGNLPQIRASPIQFLYDNQQLYGDLFSFRLVTRKFYLISHPKLVELALIKQSDRFIKMYDPQKPTGLSLVLGQGLITSRGELWQKQRRLMQPVFQRSNLVTLVPEIEKAGQNLLTRWRSLGDGAEVNLAQEMMRLTLEVITQTMFSTSVLDKIAELAPALDTVLRYAARTIVNPLSLPLAIPTRANLEFKRANALLDGLIYGIIEQRRHQASLKQDLLSMLLAARDDEASEMTNQQVRDELITIFSAGHETTANLLSWAIYHVTKQPEILAKMQAEIQEVLQGQPPSVADLPRLVYTRAVLNETLRHRPPAGLMSRKLIQDTELDGCQLKAGHLVLFNIYNLHHHADFWQEPEQFDPERFMATESRRFAYMPFGTGERICIGNHFALLESQLLLSMIMQQFELQLVSLAEVEIEMAVSLRPKGGVPVRLRRR